MQEVSLGQVAYEHIKNRICDGQFPMGCKMSEMQLASEIKISRTPVRVALARLEAEGFLTWEPNRGYRVTVFSIEDVRAIYGVRAILESEAVRLCIPVIRGRHWRPPPSRPVLFGNYIILAFPF